MRVTIDPVRDSFLLHHVVQGHPLLPSVMGIDLMARAVLADEAGATLVEVRDVVVGPPVLFIGGGPRELEVVLSRFDPDGSDREGTWTRCSVIDPADLSPDDAVYFSAFVVTSLGQQASLASIAPVRGEMTLGAQLIYPPYFHGLTFQVIAGAVAREGTVTARLAQGLPVLSWAAGRTVTSPELLELCMQTCGLWGLASDGRMMVPGGIARVVPYGRAAQLVHGGGPVEATIRPRSLDDERTVFDGEVIDETGTVLLSMEGYRTVDLGWVVEPATSARARAALGLPQPELS